MKKWGSFILSLLVLVLVGYIISTIDFYEVYLLLAKANLFWFFAAVLSCFMTFVFWNWRWKYLFRDIIKGDSGFFMHVLLAGAFFNTVTPGGGIGGEPFRAHYLGMRFKKPRTKLLGYILGDKFFQLITFAGFVLFSVFFVLIFVNIPHSLKLILEGCLIFVVLTSAITFYLIFKKVNFNPGILFKKLHFIWFIKKYFETPEDFVKYIDSRIVKFSGTFRKVVKDKRNIFVGTFLSIIFWLCNFFTAYFLFLSFGFSPNFLSVIIVVTLGDLIGALSITPGGVGITESSMVLLYNAMGFAPALGFLVAFSSRIIYYFFTLFVGGWSLVHLRKLTNNGKFSIF